MNIPNNRVGDDDDGDGGGIIIAIYSTWHKGNKQRSMDANKWPLKNKKGYLNIHITVNMRTKEILGLKITDEKGT